jgi:hypothetical protein
MRGRTTFVIAHRLSRSAMPTASSSLRRPDRGGGEHENLLGLDGEYRRSMNCSSGTRLVQHGEKEGEAGASFFAETTDGCTVPDSRKTGWVSWGCWLRGPAGVLWAWDGEVGRC